MFQRAFERLRRLGTLCGALLTLLAVPARAEPTTVTVPLMRYGLGTLQCAAYSPDGRTIATAGGIGVVLWDSETGERLRILSAPGHYVQSVAFSPDGTKVLTGSKDRTAKLWDAATGAEIRTFSGHTDWVWSVAFSPDGTKVLTGSNDNTAKLWDASTGAELRTFSGHIVSVYSVAFSPDGTKVLTGSWDGTARLWDVSMGAELRAFSGHTSGVYSVAFSPDGTKALTGSDDKTAELWDTATGSRLRTFFVGALVYSVAFSPDGTKVLTGSYDPTVKLWDASTGAELRAFSGHTDQVHSVAYSPDGTKVLTGSWDMTAKLWDASTGSDLRTFGHTDWVYSVVFSPDGRKVLTGSHDRTAKLWDVPTGSKLGAFSGHTDPVRSVAYSPDGTKVLTGSSDFTAKLWDASTGAELRAFSGQQVSPVAFSPDGTKILTGTDEYPYTAYTAKLWDAATGAEIRTFSGHTSDVTSVAFSPDGTKVLTGSWDGTAKLWDASTGAELRTLPSHTEPSYVFSVAFSSDGTKVLTGNWDNTAKMWDASTGAELRTFSGHTDQVYSVAFSPDGTKVLTGSWDQTAKLWDAATGAVIRTFSGHTDYVYSVAFSPDGTKILTGSWDGLTLLWDFGLSSRKKDKLILVAGGGAYRGNAIARQTKALAERAHLTATIRGYTPENVLYLSAFDTPETDERVDEVATAAAIETAIRDWAADAWRLTIMLLDHGDRDRNVPDWYFLANGAQSPRNFLSASELDAILDDAQSGEDPISEVHLCVDTCYSGGFVKGCAGAPPGMKRLVIAGTTDDRLASFGGQDGGLSFTSFFLSAAQQGYTFYDCFQRAEGALTMLNMFASAPQRPWLDDDGDGLYSIADGALARRRVLGNIPFFGLWVPEITDARGDAVLEQPQELNLWCRAAPGPAEVKKAEAAVAYAGGLSPEGAPIVDQTVVALERESLSNRWSATLSAATMDRAGTYNILYTAFRDDGFGVDLSGLPAIRFVTVRNGAESGEQKLILVAGGGLYAGNTISTQTQSLADAAYLTATQRRFLPDNVLYLSAFDGGTDNPHVDGGASSSAIADAIANWSAGASRLTIMLIGQTTHETGSETWNYVVDGTGSPPSLLAAADLKTMLDSAQSRSNAIPQVHLYVDTPFAGGFVKQCGAAPSGAERVVIAATSDARTASFGGQDGALSFTAFFLPAALQGNSLYDAFRCARDSIHALNVPYGAPQAPWFDDNGDSAYSPADGALARERFFGEAPSLGFLMPEIVDARPDAAIPVPEDFGLWCEMGPGEIDRVEVAVSHAGTLYDQGRPVTGFTIVPLARQGAGNCWSGVLPSAHLTAQGVYQALYTATRHDETGSDLVALPLARRIGMGVVLPTATPTPDQPATATPTQTPVAPLTPTSTATPPATPTPEPIRELVASFYQLILGRDPEPGAVNSWHIGYFQYAANFNIDVRFIPREMARLFFLSEEYAMRNRTDAEFITDCYRVFLSRDPSIRELENWLVGQWNRSQVMTVFSESEEFANRIAAMYPGLEGSPARNFVTFMYVGLLDRLVDKDGLEYAASLFDAAYAEQAFVAQPPSAVAIQESDPGGGAVAALTDGATRKRSGIEAVRAQAKQMAREVIVSPEFLGRQPTTADYVVRFYRAFLGRFPNDSEIAYWSGELDSGRRTTDNLIDLFADSAEFTARLEEYFGP